MENFKDLDDEELLQKQKEFEDIRKRFVFKPVIYEDLGKNEDQLGIKETDEAAFEAPEESKLYPDEGDEDIVDKEI